MSAETIEQKVQDTEMKVQVEELKFALLLEFPELKECDKVDLIPLWTNKITRYRLNGWSKNHIVFTRYIRAWVDGGLKYEIVS